MMTSMHKPPKSMSMFNLALILVMLAGMPTQVAAHVSTSDWTLVGQVGGSTQAVAVQDNTVYTGVGLKLTVLDVSNPANPTPLGSSAPLGDSLLSFIGFYASQQFVSRDHQVLYSLIPWVIPCIKQAAGFRPSSRGAFRSASRPTGRPSRTSR
jgi:hypothetical protein